MVENLARECALNDDNLKSDVQNWFGVGGWQDSLKTYTYCLPFVYGEMIEQEVGPLFEAIMIAQLKMYFLLDFFDPLTRSQYDQIQERVILALSEFWEKATNSDHINRFGEELLASNLQKMPSEMDLTLFTN
eukprot:Awhi_evm1s2516